MKLPPFLKFVIIFLFFTLVGCNTTTLINYMNQPVEQTNQLSKEDIKSIIISAGKTRGWKIWEVEPGILNGKYTVRLHQALIEIPYDENSYSIKYKSSNHLKYDGTNIHKKYQVWVQDLNYTLQDALRFGVPYSLFNTIDDVHNTLAKYNRFSFQFGG